LALVAVILAFSGISDLVSLSMPEEFSAIYYWGTQGPSISPQAPYLLQDYLLTIRIRSAPLRFFLSMLLVFYSYAFGSSSPLFASSSASSGRRPGHSHKASASGLEHLHNRLLFTFMFIEMMAWFWTWITLREERSGILEKMQKQRDRESHTH
jgi:hypothetical protein